MVPEGASPLGNMTLCLNEPNVKKTSNNAWMQNGAYHTPDYSQASGFNVIDFPVHYNFTSVGSVMNMVKEDNLLERRLCRLPRLWSPAQRRRPLQRRHEPVGRQPDVDVLLPRHPLSVLWL